MINFQARPKDKRIQLMATCLCDAFFDDAARASVIVLEHLGVEIDFPAGQTCCAQPAFNAGDWKNSRKVFDHTMDVFSGDAPVVVPSGSCAAMVFHGAPLAYEKEAADKREKVDQIANRTWELCDYIVNGLGITEWPGKFPKRVAFHRSCHSRGTPSGEAASTLLNSIEGLEVVEFGEKEQCCGFGGAFSVSFPNISKKMGELKLDHITAAEPDIIVSSDMGCMLHLGGILDRNKKAIPRLHIAQVLRDALLFQG